jgi:ubiquitin-associated and SH3 domain-containing protein
LRFILELKLSFLLVRAQVGELREELGIFWQKSRLKFGWNGAHNSFPHITLTSSFKCPDAKVEALVRAVCRVGEHVTGDLMTSSSLRLERYASPNFFGLFVAKEHEALLKRLSADLCQELGGGGGGDSGGLGLRPEPILKSFHLTLAYQFQQKHFAGDWAD